MALATISPAPTALPASKCARKGCGRVGLWRFAANDRRRLCDECYCDYCSKAGAKARAAFLKGETR